MNITILSGKGGTGKTTISTNLAVYLNSLGYKIQYLDCDVEEPNGYIFLKPDLDRSIDVKVKVPDIEKSICINCGRCAENCNFNALAVTDDSVVVFEKLCHSCGLCSIVCPVGAIHELDRVIGKVEIGYGRGVKALRGLLNIGEPMAIPIIDKLKENIDKNMINVLDSSPGSSCKVINTLEDTDYAVLITEPTKFGLHDLEIAVKLVNKMKIPFGVVINKATEDDIIIEEYCKEQEAQIIGKIPFKKDIAKNYSKGKLLTNNEEVKKCLEKISVEVIRRLKK